MPWLQRHRGRGAAVAGATEPQQQHAIALVEIHDLDVPAVGRDVGPERVQRALDAINKVHAPPVAEFLLP